MVIACDPGNKSFSKYDPNQDVRDRPEEAKEILNLSSGAYNNEIWLKQYQQKLEKKPLNPEYHVARDTSSQNSLKSVFLTSKPLMRSILPLEVQVLKKVYRSYEYRNFRLYKANQNFDAAYVEKTVHKFERESGGRTEFCGGVRRWEFPITYESD